MNKNKEFYFVKIYLFFFPLIIGLSSTIALFSSNVYHEDWSNKSIIYQIYWNSFKSTGSGTDLKDYSLSNPEQELGICPGTTCTDTYINYGKDQHGDLVGIVQKLDYIKSLGVDYVWITPFFQSPWRDGGYDISDYYRVNSAAGTTGDFEELIKEAQNSELKVVIDLVLNHTSNQHPWFQWAIGKEPTPAERNKYSKPPYNWDIPMNKEKLMEKYQKYYYFEKTSGERPSKPFLHKGESDQHGQSGLVDRWQCLDKEKEGKCTLWFWTDFFAFQPALNWNNPTVRKEMIKVANFWINKGVKGFRLDAISSIGKNFNAKSYSEFYNKKEQYDWLSRFANQTYFKKSISKKEKFFVVGEEGTDNTYLYGKYGKLFNIFNFELVRTVSFANSYWFPGRIGNGSDNELNRWPPHLAYDAYFNDKVNPVTINSSLIKTQSLFKKGVKLGIFAGNHDWSRAVSRFPVKENQYLPFDLLSGSEKDRETNKFLLAKKAEMIAMMFFSLRGSQFIYQGEEIGMTNYPFSDVSEVRDVRALLALKYLRSKGYPKKVLMEKTSYEGRDNSRTPMQWSSEQNAGFNEQNINPWINVNPNYLYINVKDEENDPNDSKQMDLNQKSVLNFYRELTRLRKNNDVLAYGNINLLNLASKHSLIVGFEREYKGKKILFIANLSNRSQTLYKRKIGDFIGRKKVIEKIERSKTEKIGIGSANHIILANNYYMMSYYFGDSASPRGDIHLEPYQSLLIDLDKLLK